MNQHSTIQTNTHHGGQFQPGTWLLNFRTMGGSVSRFGDMFALQFPETGDDTLIEMHNALTVEERQRLRTFLQVHFGGEA